MNFQIRPTTTGVRIMGMRMIVRKIRLPGISWLKSTAMKKPSTNCRATAPATNSRVTTRALATAGSVRICT